MGERCTKTSETMLAWKQPSGFSVHCVEMDEQIPLHPQSTLPPRCECMAMAMCWEVFVLLTETSVTSQLQSKSWLFSQAAELSCVTSGCTWS